MLDKAKRISTVLVIRGLLSLVFGVLMLSLPPEQLVSVVLTLFGIFAIVDRDSHHIGPSTLQIAHLANRGGHILSRRGSHALHCNPLTVANCNTANSYRPRRVAC